MGTYRSADFIHWDHTGSLSFAREGQHKKVPSGSGRESHEGISVWNRGNVHMSFAEFVITPTGDYSTDNPINQGLNYWSFDTNFALTYLNPETGRDLSFNLGYIYNTENDATDYRTGQELHLDVVLNQFFSETFAAGIQGFYLNQISGDSGAGALLGDYEAEAAGAGPALMWARRIGKQDVTFIAKWLHEFHAENRLEGDHVYVSFALDW